MRVLPAVTEISTIKVRKWDSSAVATRLQTGRLVDLANMPGKRRRKPRKIVKLKKLVHEAIRQRVAEQTGPAPKGK